MSPLRRGIRDFRNLVTAALRPSSKPPARKPALQEAGCGASHSLLGGDSFKDYRSRDGWRCWG
jgi:hypothetical protein